MKARIFGGIICSGIGGIDIRGEENGCGNALGIAPGYVIRKPGSAGIIGDDDHLAGSGESISLEWGEWLR
jgi:hypothetical protein